MNKLTTVFEINEIASKTTNIGEFPWIIPLLIGVLIVKLIIGPIPRKGRISALLAGGIMTAALIMIYQVSKIPDPILTIYQNGKCGQCQITEGIVHVFSVQPFTGHAPGDKITVGNQPFDVNYFRSGGYTTTISHGGVLREGVFTRLTHYKGMILKIELGTDGTGQQGVSAAAVRPESGGSGEEDLGVERREP